MSAVVLYGPPAAGKDTVTEALRRLSPAYRLFPRLKVGGGRTQGYRMVSADELRERRDAGHLLWENARYNATYAVDREHLAKMMDSGAIPVVHLGQVEAVQAVTSGFPEARWLTVYLWCPRDVALRRIEERATGDTDARMQAWDQTPPLTSTDLTINSAVTAPDQAAAQIHAKLRESAKR